MFNISVNNYRSFLKQKLNFSRVNILIGENSGGKSSLLKLLLVLKQTLASPTDFNLKLTGDYTNLGNFEEVVYYKKKKRNITIAVEAKDDYHNFFIDFILHSEKPSKKVVRTLNNLDSFRASKTEITFEFSSKLDDHTSIKTYITNDTIGSLEIIQKKNKDQFIRQRTCDLKFEFGDINGIITDCYCYKEGFLTLFEFDLKKKCDELFKNNSESVFYRLVYLLVIQNYIIEQVDKIRFVNPIVNSPKRFYFQEDKKTSYTNINLEEFINILNDKSLTPKQYADRISLLNKTLKDFGIADEIEIVRDKQLPVLALNVKTKDFWSNITDVGYGVSLQIPIIFQAIISEHYTKKGHTLLIEQPETHLHPSLQAKFIETLLSIGSKNSYFIETHSEHIIRKLQVLIKKQEFGLKPGDVTIHYFKREASKFQVTSHSINSDGKLQPNFPSGFYDTSYSLVKELL